MKFNELIELSKNSASKLFPVFVGYLEIPDIDSSRVLRGIEDDIRSLGGELIHSGKDKELVFTISGESVNYVSRGEILFEVELVESENKLKVRYSLIGYRKRLFKGFVIIASLDLILLLTLFSGTLYEFVQHSIFWLLALLSIFIYAPQSVRAKSEKVLFFFMRLAMMEPEADKGRNKRE